MNNIYRFFTTILFEIIARYINNRYYLWAILYKKRQAKLARKYAVSEVLPEMYTQRHIDKMKSLENSDSFYILTSDTSNIPKKILATKKRFINFELEFMASIFSVIKHRLNYKTFFSFASVAQDESFTDMATRLDRDLLRIELLQAPFKLMYTPLFRNIYI